MTKFEITENEQTKRYEVRYPGGMLAIDCGTQDEAEAFVKTHENWKPKKKVKAKKNKGNKK